MYHTDTAKTDAAKAGHAPNANPPFPAAGDYIVQTGYQNDTNDTITDRLLLLAERISQIGGECR